MPQFRITDEFNRRVGEDFKKLPKLVDWVKENICPAEGEKEESRYRGYTVWQRQRGEEDLQVELEALMQAYEDGECPEDLYFF